MANNVQLGIYMEQKIMLMVTEILSQSVNFNKLFQQERSQNKNQRSACPQCLTLATSCVFANFVQIIRESRD
jgi:protein-arginine kinase activator protein McsA